MQNAAADQGATNERQCNCIGQTDEGCRCQKANILQCCQSVGPCNCAGSDGGQHHKAYQGQSHRVYQTDEWSGCKQGDILQGACCGDGGLFDAGEIYNWQTHGAEVAVGVKCCRHDVLRLAFDFR